MSDSKPKLVSQWQVGSLLARGGHGDVYKGIDNDGKKVAMKIEHNDSPRKVLAHEVVVYSMIHASEPKPTGFAQVYYSGHVDNNKVLVMQRLGISLDHYIINCKGKIPVVEMLQLGVQGIERLEYLHGCGFIHRSVKPGNLMLGRDDPKTLYLIDYGLAKCYSTHDRNVEENKRRHVVGSLKYMSVRAQNGEELSRRDDLESLAYSLIYAAKGTLPWEKIRCRSVKEMIAKKKNISTENLCGQLPNEIGEFLNYVKGLDLHEQPDYRFMKKLFQRALESVSESNSK